MVALMESCHGGQSFDICAQGLLLKIMPLLLKGICLGATQKSLVDKPVASSGKGPTHNATAESLGFKLKKAGITSALG